MKQDPIQSLCKSFSYDEISLLEQLRQDFEMEHSVQFVNLEAYVTHLAKQVIQRQQQGEFVPRSLEEAKVGHYL